MVVRRAGVREATATTRWIGAFTGRVAAAVGWALTRRCLCRGRPGRGETNRRRERPLSPPTGPVPVLGGAPPLPVGSAPPRAVPPPLWEGPSPADACVGPARCRQN